MLHNIYAKKALALVAAALISLPALAMGQQTTPQVTASGCKQTYKSCVQSKALTDDAGKTQCADAYKQCLSPILQQQSQAKTQSAVK